MTIRHHPGDETLMRLAAGRLGAGPGLVVAVHLEGCAACRTRLCTFEAVGGALLESLPAASLAPDLFGRTMERLETVPARSSAPSPLRPDMGLDLPRAMAGCEIGPWKWLGPGFQWSKVRVASDPDAKIMLLKGRPGLHLPAHGHTGIEFMQVLQGALADDRGVYAQGDMDEADDSVDHRPVVGPDGECVCLAALEGDTRLHGVLGHLLRPLVGF